MSYSPKKTVKFFFKSINMYENAFNKVVADYDS